LLVSRRAAALAFSLPAVLAISLASEELPSVFPFRLVPSDITGIAFCHGNGAQGQKQMIEIMGSGVALFDYNNDGKLDIFFVNGAALPSLEKTESRFYNRLYRNDGNLHFTDVTAEAGVAGIGYGMGAAAADFDNDGNVDLYVTQFGRNQLLRNLGNGHFEDVTGRAGVGATCWSTSAAFFDYDHDGYLDLFVARYLSYPINRHQGCGDRGRGLLSYCLPDEFPASTNLLFHNNGNGTFTDVSERSGIASSRGKALGVAVSDLDGDGWEDLVVANDRMPNSLFRNRGNGSFEEVGTPAGVGYSRDGIARAGMGVDIADFDRDGKPDVAISNFEAEGLALFRGVEGVFEDEAGSRGLYEPSYIFAVNGHVLDDIERYRPGSSFAEQKLIFHNEHGRFALVSPAAGTSMSEKRVGRGAAFGDLNNDGLIDAVVSNNAGVPDIVLNQSSKKDHHSVLIRFTGTKSNRDGLGVRITAHVGPGTRTYQVSGSGSYLSQSDTRLHIGLATAELIDELNVVWPSGTREIIHDLQADRIYVIQENRGIKSSSPIP
jgi:enediyne biosynthesis protein E4